MSHWKTLGYVPDSDEEDIEDNLQSPEPNESRDKAEQTWALHGKAPARIVQHNTNQHEDLALPSTNASGPSISNQLERTIGHGLELVRELLNPNLATARNLDTSEEDSPLSSLQTSPASSPSRLAPSYTHTQPVEAEHVSQHGIAGSPVPFASRRNLRTRAPIQEHPYMLEDAKYRKLMKDRGIRPVNVPNLSTFETPVNPEEESQQTEDFQSSSAGQSFDFDASSPIRSMRSSEQDHDIQQSISDAENFEDGLPDLAQLLRGRVRVSGGLRPSNRPHDQAPRHKPSKNNSTEINGDDRPVNSSESVLNDQAFRVPPSPPSSQSHEVWEDEEDVIGTHRLNRDKRTPKGLPTPLLSSEAGIKRRSVTISSLSDSSHSGDEDEDAAMVSSPNAGEDESQGLSWIRQRLRGVLPPSFVKLDMQKQSRKTYLRNVDSSTAVPVERGIARRMPGGHSKAVQRLDTDVLQSSESESSDLDDPKHGIQRPVNDVPLELPLDDLHKPRTIDHNDLAEEDVIDYMLPSGGPRPHRGRARSGKQRQRRLDDDWMISNRDIDFVAPSTRPTGKRLQTKVNRSRYTQPVKRKKLAHRRLVEGINVMDAPDLVETDKTHQAQFLRLAARQARKHTNQVNYSPAKKFFLLATEQDTEELRDQVRSWEMQRKKRVSRGVTRENMSTRSPYKSVVDITGAYAARRTLENGGASSTVDLESLKQATDTLLRRTPNYKPFQHQPDQVHSQTAYVDLTAKDDPHSKRSHLRSLFTHHNRSGQGQLLRRAPTARAAQVETEASGSDLVTSLPIRFLRTVKSVRRASIPTSMTKEKPTDNFIRKEQQSSHQNRRAKKQYPHRTTAAAQKMDPTPGFNVMLDKPQEFAGADVSTDQEKMHLKNMIDQWAQRAAVSVHKLGTCPTGYRFSTNSLVGRGAIMKLFEISSQSVDITTPTSAPVSVTRPSTQQQLDCWQYNEEVWAHIAGCLDETHRMLFQSEQSEDKDYSVCGRSIQTIVEYTQFAAFYTDTDLSALENMEDFIHNICWWTNNFITSYKAVENVVNSSWRQSVLACMNGLAVLVVHFLHIVRNKSTATQVELEDLSEQLMKQMLLIALNPATLFDSLERVECIVATTTPGFIDDSKAFPEAESLLIAWYICDVLFHERSDKIFCENMQIALANSGQQNATLQLGQCIVVVCFVLPLVKLAAQGNVFEPPRFENKDGACFSFIASYLHDLIAQAPSGQASSFVGLLLESVDDLCLKIVQEWYWSPPPVIATALLKAYHWNALLPFNTTPDHGDVFETSIYLPYDIPRHVNNDFLKFLKLVHFAIDDLCHQSNNDARADNTVSSGKLRGLIFSLIPNNAREFDAKQEIQADQFLALINHFNLYVTLFTSASSGFHPRLAQLEQQVDLSTSHRCVCSVAIAAWKAIALHCAGRILNQEILDGLNHWMFAMLGQSITRFEKHHQFDAIDLLKELFLAFAAALKACSSELKARALLQGTTLEMISTLLTRKEIHQNNEKVLLGGLEVLSAYASQTQAVPVIDTLTGKVQLILRTVIKDTLSAGLVIRKNVLLTLMVAWFTTAHAMVKCFHKHWHDFFTPQSNLSIDFLSGSHDSYAAYEAKCIFYGKTIEADPAYYFLELRPSVFMTWIAALLIPVHAMQFEHLLTNAIIMHERDSLMIKDLATRLLKGDTTRSLTLQDVVDSRLTILRHIIQNVYLQQHDPEGEWLAGGLESETQKQLMRTMTKTMKETWLSLKDQPDAQKSYTEVVHAVINEMETYPIQDFKIDPWFTNGIGFPRPKQTLDNMFKCRFGESGSQITKENITSFRYYYSDNMQANKLQFLVDDILRVFLCNDPLRAMRSESQQASQFSIDFVKQAKFIQIVFPAIIERSKNDDCSIFFHPTMRALTEIAKNVQFRLDALDVDNMRYYFVYTTAVLATILLFLKATQVEHTATATMLEYTRIAIASVLNLAEYGIDINEPIYELCITNVLGIYAVVKRWADDNVLAIAEPNISLNEPHYDESVPDEWLLEDKDVATDEPPVYDSWDGPATGYDTLSVLPLDFSWLLHGDVSEPVLDREEQELREYARREFRACKDVILPGIIDHDKITTELSRLGEVLMRWDLVDGCDELE